jgi:hypothetical protein
LDQGLGPPGDGRTPGGVKIINMVKHEGVEYDMGMSNRFGAIPTEYAGTMFRSRLEAEWALNLDALGERWIYEPEGFELPSGGRYLPDFYLPEAGPDGSWLEIKGPTVPGLDRTLEFAHWVAHRPEHREHVGHCTVACRTCRPPRCSAGDDYCTYWVDHDDWCCGSHLSSPWQPVFVGSVPIAHERNTITLIDDHDQGFTRGVRPKWLRVPSLWRVGDRMWFEWERLPGWRR